jgi:chitin synthase
MDDKSLPQRRHTLSHRERAKTIRKLVANSHVVPTEKKPSFWAKFAKVVTCCFPGCALRCCGLETSGVRQAWREKVALCFIIALISATSLFIMLFLGNLLCPYKARELQQMAKLRKSNGGIDYQLLLFTVGDVYCVYCRIL